MRALHLALAITLCSATAAAAADLTVEVKSADGRPVRDAVVMVRMTSAAAAAPIRFTWPLVMSQQDVAFNPHVLIVPVGSQVSFPNKDTVRHHVYSFSPTKKFELKLYGRDESRGVRFDKAGIVALGCNIHDQMIGFIYVTDTPYVAKSGASGEAVIRGVPGGAASLVVWHPNLKARKPVAQPLTVAGAVVRQAITIDLRPATRAH